MTDTTEALEKEAIQKNLETALAKAREELKTTVEGSDRNTALINRIVTITNAMIEESAA